MNLEPEAASKPKRRFLGTLALVVLAVVFILGASTVVAVKFVLSPFQCQLNEGCVASCEALFAQLEQALHIYRLDHGILPSETAGLLELSKKSDKGYYFEFKAGQLGANNRILDPWGRPIVYRIRMDANSRDHVELYSFGPNGIDENGGVDDVASWK